MKLIKFTIAAAAAALAGWTVCGVILTCLALRFHRRVMEFDALNDLDPWAEFDKFS